jgi:UDP-N-acetylglucosamine--N-acetylmuramyl-(pentapeptide) pyrophosphoryl-undecaprenol N-acetylglucosamine transferase
MSNKPIKVLFAAGGTGGHLFPAAVVRDELERRGCEVYLVTDARGKKYAEGFARVSTIVGGQWSGEGLWRRTKTLFLLGIGCLQSMWHLLRVRPRVVIGMGGYISVPVVACGWLLGRRTVIFNADSVLGNANIFLKRFATKIAAAFPEVTKRAVVTGLPVRPGIIRAAGSKFNPAGPIVVMGGSQGAQLLSETVPEAIARMDKKPRVFHQARPEDLASVQKAYRAAGIDATVESFFAEPEKLLSECSLFIGRAGANTVYEIGTVGRPAIFVPIEHRDQQQVLNARKLADVGGAILIREHDLSPGLLALTLDDLARDPKKLEKMAARAKIFENVNAAANIADLVLG